MTKTVAMSNEEPVKRFENIALKQFDAIRIDDNAAFRRLYRQMDEVDNELRRGSSRRPLMP